MPPMKSDIAEFMLIPGAFPLKPSLKLANDINIPTNVPSIPIETNIGGIFDDTFILFSIPSALLY